MNDPGSGPRDGSEIHLPRKNFLRMLVAGVGLLAPASIAARAQSHRPESGENPSAAGAEGATKVLIIRHAEKPAGQISGVDESGNADPNSLIPQGWQRTGALFP